MADSSKPTDSPTGGPSPISPQIKVPPSSAGNPPPAGGSNLPPNLPVKELNKPDLNIVPPPRPPVSAPPPPPRPSSPQQVPTQPPTSPSPVFKSSIRTMQDDMKAAQTGQAPSGVSVSKQAEKDAPSAPVQAPKITPPPPRAGFSVPQVDLGGLEKSKSLPGSDAPKDHPATSVPIPESSQKPGFNVPKPQGRNKGLTLWAIIGIVVVGIVVAIFFVSREPSVTQVTPTPEASAPVLSRSERFLEAAFGSSATVSVASNAVIFSNLEQNQVPDPSALREPKTYKILNPDDGQRLGFSDLMTSLLIQPPADITSAVEDKSLYLSLMYQQNNTFSRGFVVHLTSSTIGFSLNNWETSLSQGMKDLFGYDATFAASSAFLDNIYRGVAIRYRNFPDHSKTIDYAIVTASNGETYLVFTSSREHIYSMIDKLLKVYVIQ